MSTNNNYEKLEDHLVYDLGETVDYCRCGHSDLDHISPMNESDNPLRKFRCEICDCVNFR